MCLVALAGCNGDPLVHDLSERDANRLITELHGEGIDATKRSQPDGRYSLEVAPTGIVGALQFLEANRLLKEGKEGKPAGESFGASREDRRFRYERSMSRELEATLERIPGIREARVHLNIPPADSPLNRGGDLLPPSASVLVVTSPKAEVDREGLARLIGGAAGIGAPQVNVIVETAAVPTERSREVHGVQTPQRPAESGWSRVGLPDVSGRWMVAAALLSFGVLLIGHGIRTPRTMERAPAPRGA